VWALALAVVAVLYGMWKLSFGYFTIAVGFFVFLAVGAALESRRLRRLAKDRQEEDLCTFARAFDRRSIDPRIIRAVYEGLQDHYQGFPIRSTDRFVEDLKMDNEDLDEFIADIAGRIGRSMAGVAGNPLNGRISSVNDLVLFYIHQDELGMPDKTLQPASRVRG